MPPALNFTLHVHKIETGQKRQTIRAYRRDGHDPTPGCRLYLFTGQRTAHCRRLVAPIIRGLIRLKIPGLKLGTVVQCKSTHRIELRYINEYRAAVGSPCKVERLARLDGFTNARELFEWAKSTHGLPFRGLLIRW